MISKMKYSKKAKRFAKLISREIIDLEPGEKKEDDKVDPKLKHDNTKEENIVEQDLF